MTSIQLRVPGLDRRRFSPFWDPSDGDIQMVFSAIFLSKEPSNIRNEIQTVTKKEKGQTFEKSNY